LFLSLSQTAHGGLVAESKFSKFFRVVHGEAAEDIRIVTDLVQLMREVGFSAIKDAFRQSEK